MAVSALLALLLGSTPQIPAPARPNIVFLYTDDQARWGVGAFGNREVITPHLDRLAREGALFVHAFTTTPVCSPSRAGMLTGRYGTEVGITDWINATVEPEVGLDPAITTWPEVLQANGYATGLFGKWHLGDAPRYHPRAQGYDHFFGFVGGGNRPMEPTLEVEGQIRQLEGSLPDLLVEDAIRFITSHQDRPFLVSIHFRAPHAPYAPVPEIDSAPYETLDPTIPDPPGLKLPVERVKKLTREYYASIHSVDRNVGRVLQTLDDLGLTGKTVVIATSDHGYNIGHHGLWHKGNATWLAVGRSGRRPNMFEESIQVPLLIRWPSVVKPGTRVDQLVTNLDTFASILDLAGVTPPPDPKRHGRSWVPLLRGTPGAWDETLFGQYDMHHGAEARMRMIRKGAWKLVRHFENHGVDELYDLAHDPGETTNLAQSAEHRPLIADLDRRLRAWMASINDPLR